MTTTYRSCFNISDEIELEQRAFDLGQAAYKEHRQCDPKDDYDKLVELIPTATVQEMNGLMKAWRRGCEAAEAEERSE